MMNKKAPTVLSSTVGAFAWDEGGGATAVLLLLQVSGRGQKEPGLAMIGGLFFLPALFALPPLVLELEEHLLYDEYPVNYRVRVCRVFAFGAYYGHFER